MTTKRSFFDRLSGAASSGDSFDSFDDEIPATTTSARGNHASEASLLSDDGAKSAGQLPVDVHQTTNEIVIRAFVAGVRPDELSISISRDMVELSGSRSEREQVSEHDYFSRELFWGSFSRTILLPEEVDVDMAEASEKHGILMIRLPKINKKRQTKLKVRSR